MRRGTVQSAVGLEMSGHRMTASVHPLVTFFLFPFPLRLVPMERLELAGVFACEHFSWIAHQPFVTRIPFALLFHFLAKRKKERIEPPESCCQSE